MASYSTVKSGSKGSSVSELQTLLNDKGYDLSVDGIFGSKTQAAVRDYQSKNGLSVDGIVGKNTWNALTGGSSGASSGSSSAVAASPSPAGSAGYMQQLQEMMNQVTSGSAVLTAIAGCYHSTGKCSVPYIEAGKDSFYRSGIRRYILPEPTDYGTDIL